MMKILFPRAAWLLNAAKARECDIADPWYMGNFDATYDDILEGRTARPKGPFVLRYAGRSPVDLRLQWHGTPFIIASATAETSRQ